MEKRSLGRTGVKLSVVGFGGIMVMNEPSSSASRMVAQAIERGVNYFDVAPTYGNAEECLGPALNQYRESVFLACKTEKRTKDEAGAELRQSLQRLHTDYLDLYQLHRVDPLEVDLVMGEDGAIEALVEAREQGLVKYLGFSAHSEEAALMLLDRFRFDTVLFPFNWVCWHQGRLGAKVLVKAQEKGVAVLALKALAKRKLRKEEERRWPKCWYAPVENPDEASLALRFTLSLPVTAAVSPGHAELLRWACDAVDQLKPLSAQEHALLAEKSQGLESIFP